ncbi:hypothetical protein ACJX0J_007356, partial [Zea mays]
MDMDDMDFREDDENLMGANVDVGDAGNHGKRVKFGVSSMEEKELYEQDELDNGILEEVMDTNSEHNLFARTIENEKTVGSKMKGIFWNSDGKIFLHASLPISISDHIMGLELSWLLREGFFDLLKRQWGFKYQVLSNLDVSLQIGCLWPFIMIEPFVLLLIFVWINNDWKLMSAGGRLFGDVYIILMGHFKMDDVWQNLLRRKHLRTHTLILPLFLSLFSVKSMYSFLMKNAKIFMWHNWQGNKKSSTQHLMKRIIIKVLGVVSASGLFWSLNILIARDAFHLEQNLNNRST